MEANLDGLNLVVDIKEGIHISALTKETSGSSSPSYVCVVKFHGKEVGKTKETIDSTNIIWRDPIVIPIDDSFAQKQTDHNRHFFFEYLDVHVFDSSKSHSDRIGETRIPLIDIGTTKWYKVLRPGCGGNFVEFETTARLEITIDTTRDLNALLPSGLFRCMLSELVRPDLPQHQHLFLDTGMTWISGRLLGSLNLPGPLIGEVVLDRHTCVEVGSFCLGQDNYVSLSLYSVFTDIIFS